MIKKKIILVSGGAGYIGSTVVNHLVDKGFKVLIIDNLSTGSTKLINKKANFIKCDIKFFKSMKKKLFNYREKIFAIFHFAASLSVSESQKKPLKYYKNNVIGTKNILAIARLFKVNKFIFSSTCAVYGNISKVKISENDPTVPVSNYGKSKLAAEMMIKKSAKKYNLKYAILRYFNVVGADFKNRSGQISGKTIFKVLSKNLIKKKYIISIFGNNYNTKDGTCIRDYIDVNDLSKLHILSLEKLNNHKSFILNCGYGKPYSVKEIIQEFSNYLKKKINLKFKKKRAGDMEAIFCNISKLKKIFPRWKPSANIRSSVKTSLKWEKKLSN